MYHKNKVQNIVLLSRMNCMLSMYVAGALQMFVRGCKFNQSFCIVALKRFDCVGVGGPLTHSPLTLSPLQDWHWQC